MVQYAAERGISPQKVKFTHPDVETQKTKHENGGDKMKALQRTVTAAMVLAFLMGLLSLPALAQDKPADNMDLVREKISADKKLFIADNLGLTESESKAFWPVYKEYQKEMDALEDKLLALIEDFAANFETMSDAKANELIDKYILLREKSLKLEKSYLPKFREVLSGKKVTRYYQLENKIRAIGDFELAALIPIVE